MLYCRSAPTRAKRSRRSWQHFCRRIAASIRTSIDLSKVDYDVDVLVIGGGGAGASAAIEADEAGAKVMIVTKLRIGDANTMMAEGGIQAADKPNDSPAIHYLDAMGGGHFTNKPELLCKLVLEAPAAIQWLNDLGVEFDKAPDGTMITTHGGGTSRKRMHAAKDYSGAEIMRTLRDEVLNRRHSGRGLHGGDRADSWMRTGKAAGAVLLNMETQEITGCAGKDGHHRNGRCRTAALSGLPDLQPLRRDGGRPDPGLSRRREAAVCGHAAVSPDGRRLSRSRSSAHS